MRKTKIVCTLGPASRDEKTLTEMLKAGMNVARMNFSHGDHEYHRETIETFRRVRDRLGVPAAVMLDTKGPEIRIGTFTSGSVILKNGQDFTLTTDEIEGDETRVSVTYKDLPQKLKEGDRVLINDGLLALRVKSLTDTDIHCTVEVGGKLSNRKGVEYEEAPTSATQPEEPEDGDLWIDTKYNKLMIYSSVTLTWTELTDVYTKIIIPAQAAGNRPTDKFKEFDAVTIEGSSIDALNGSKVLYTVADTYVVVIGVLDNEITDTGVTLKLYQTVPEMDFVIECQNRLWGCFYGKSADGKTINEIYCSALGDFKNWNRFLGISTDSFIASVGTDGPWTGAVNYLGYPTFFKADHIHRVSVSPIGAHQIQDTPCRGVQPGSSKSIAIINETLYYKARESICAYQGGFPSDISSALGEVMYHDAVAGSYGDRYYLSMLDADDNAHLFCCDLKNGLWMREDDLRVSEFARIAEELYAASGNKLYALRGSDGVLEKRVVWYAETGMQYYEYPDKKYLSRFNIRLKMEKGARLRIFLEYDSDGYWLPSGEIIFSGTNTVTVPIRPRRCDHLRMRLEGNGEVKIFSIARILEVGSDI